MLKKKKRKNNLEQGEIIQNSWCELEWRYLVSVIDLYSFVFQKVLETSEIIIRDIAGESSVAEWYHRVSPMQGLWKKWNRLVKNWREIVCSAKPLIENLAN